MPSAEFKIKDQNRDRSDRLRIVACIPALNEEKTIASVIIQTQRHVDKVVVCDDGSNDMTAEIARRLGAEVISHKRNIGYGGALETLFARARELEADVLVTLDGDGQHDPNDIPKIVDPIIQGGADIIIGSRFLGGELNQVPKYRKMGIKAITGLTDMISYNGLTDSQSGFRAYNKRAINVLRPSERGMGASTEILIKAHNAGLKVKEVPIIVSYSENTSTYNPVYQGVSVLLSTIKHLSVNHPILFYGIPGLVSLTIAFLFWLWTLDIYVSTRAIVTNIALIAVVATLTGLMLMTTAIILWVIVSVVRESARAQIYSIK